MSQNYFTAIAVGASNHPNTVNNRLGTLDAQITFNTQQLGNLNLSASTLVTRANGGETSGSTNIDVDSTTGFATGDTIGYTTANGYEERTATVASGTQFTVAAIGGNLADNAIITLIPPAIANAAAAGNRSGTYTLDQTMAHALGERYNAKRYGAIGDGVTNDTSALQDWIDDAVAAGRGLLELPKGLYLSGNLDLSGLENVIIGGEGKIVLTGTGTGTSNYIGLKLGGTMSNVVIRDITIEGDGVDGNWHAGVWVAAGATLTDVIIANVKVSDCQLGIAISAAAGSTVTASKVLGCSITNIVGEASGNGYGIQCGRGTTGDGVVVVANNYIDTCDRHSIYCSNGGGVIIAGNIITNHRSGLGTPASHRPAINIARSANVLCAHNIIKAPKDGAIAVGAGTTGSGYVANTIIVANNSIYDPTGNFPIFIIGSIAPTLEEDTQYVTISGNLLYQSGSNVGQVIIYTGRNILYQNNHHVMLGVTSSVTAMQIRAGGEQLDVSAATNANPCQLTTSVVHGLSNGQSVYIIGGTGNWTGINGTQTVTVVNTTNFTIPVDSTSYGAKTGTIQVMLVLTAATAANPTQLTTGSPHGLTTGQSVSINGGTGNWAGINGTWTVTVVDTTNFTIGVNASTFGAFSDTTVTVSTAIYSDDITVAGNQFTITDGGGGSAAHALDFYTAAARAGVGVTIAHNIYDVPGAAVAYQSTQLNRNVRVLFDAIYGHDFSLLKAGSLGWNANNNSFLSINNLRILNNFGLMLSTNVASGNPGIWFGNGVDTIDCNLYRAAANVLHTDDKFTATAGLGAGNSAAASSLGSVVKKMEVFDASGNSLGYLPIYDAIT